MLLRCLSNTEAAQIVVEAHARICGAHQSGTKLHLQIKRMGYYWPTMVKDYLDYPQPCKLCQYHANFIHKRVWGLDMVGPMRWSIEGYTYILSATDYFFKWVQAKPIMSGKQEEVVDFIKSNIIYRYGVPKTTTQAMPYALVYGTGVVLPLEEAYPSGAYLMTDEKGKKVGPINGRYLKLYYP
ncbi:hypothetical protein LIER_29789 [Lithospermum erythrorhizon]|uniref:Integrase zinc-binding domain-containing protein n=1 Tax=Lithospermum erythrorhizon TaxID=34254 RepID=A0AAV3RLV4_LITER